MNIILYTYKFEENYYIIRMYVLGNIRYIPNAYEHGRDMMKEAYMEQFLYLLLETKPKPV